MAVVNIPDSMVPEGYEVDSAAPVKLRGFEGRNYIVTYTPLRRKPRLKQIVFTVAGDERIIMPGEWYELGNELLLARSNTSGVYFPLERSEVYE